MYQKLSKLVKKNQNPSQKNLRKQNDLSTVVVKFFSLDAHRSTDDGPLKIASPFHFFIKCTVH